MDRGNNGAWIQTYQGRPFWPLMPSVLDISIYDIAHALALQCRWTGHCRTHYSVGQHSVLVSYEVPEADALQALLHDASEAYIQDIARPTKPLLSNYSVIEAKIMDEVLRRFGLPRELSEAVKIADDRLLFAEARDLMRAPAMPWTNVPKCAVEYTKRIRPWPMWYTEIRFLLRFAELTAKSRRGVLKQWAKNKWFDLRQGWYGR